MKKFTIIFAWMLFASYLAAQTDTPTDTTFRYNNRSVTVKEKDNEINVSVFRQNEQGDTIKSEKIYEGIFVDGKSVERQYQNRFEISVPEIFKPKEKRKDHNSHWAGFGVGFSNISPDGEFSSILDRNRSIQYNLNFAEGVWYLGNSDFTIITGGGIQFNSIHFQTNKAIKVIDYKSTIVDAEKAYNTSRLHYTYGTFPFLIEKAFPIGRDSYFFINGGIVAKVKMTSSSKVWINDENGKETKIKMDGELNIRPITFDFVVQAGYENFGFFASYSPLSVFINDKGPKGNQATVGLQFYF